MNALRIFIADSDRTVRAGLQMLLDFEPGMKVVGIAVQSEGFVAQAEAALPDTVLVDWQLLEDDSAEYIKELHSLSSQPQIIVMNIDSDIENDATSGEADHYFCTAGHPDRLLEILKEIKEKRMSER